MKELRHSYSSLHLFHRCPRAWAYRFIAGYEPIGREGSLHQLRGQAFHSLLEADLLQRGAAAGSLLIRPDKITLVPGLSLGINWQTQGIPTIPTVDLATEIELGPLSVLSWIRDWESGLDPDLRKLMTDLYEDTLANRLHDLWLRYLNHYGAEMSNFLPMLTEYEWAREAPNGKLLQGRLDCLGYNTTLGLIELRDAKTNESWPMHSDEVVELYDSQLHLSAWGVAPVLREHADFIMDKFNEANPLPRLTTYDRIRWKKPTEPRLTAKGALDKRVSDFSPEGYKAFFETPEALEAGVQMDETVYNGLSAPGKWFRRKSAPVNINIISTHIYGLQDLAARATDTTLENALLVPSSDNCARCEFQHLCEAELRGGRFAIDERELAEYGLQKQPMEEE